MWYTSMVHNRHGRHGKIPRTTPLRRPDTISQISEKTGLNFSTHNHTQAMYFYKIRPRGNSKDPKKTNLEFCVYHSARKDYTYSQKWVDFLVDKICEPEELKKIKTYKL